MRNIVSAFGTLFNDINIIRKTSSGDVVNMQKVPLAYGPRQKFLTRIDEQPTDLNDDSRIAIKLPRMSFEITSFAYDASTNLNSLTRNIDRGPEGTGSRRANYAPYLVNMQLNIMAKNQDDALQILEQIIPTFQPDYTLTVKYKEGVSVDMPITLNSVTHMDDYEADFLTRRLLIYTLDFELKVRFYGRDTENVPLIKSAYVDFTTSDDNKFLTALTAKVDPQTAEETDVYTIREFAGLVPTNYVFNVTTSNLTGTFTEGEYITGATSGSEGQIQVIDENTYRIKFADNYFIIGEVISGSRSSATAEIATLTIGDLYE